MENKGSLYYFISDVHLGLDFHNPLERERKLVRVLEGLPAETDNKVQLIENPLPVPKKHVPKVLDYKLNDDVSDFDYPVADDDDFDH